MKNTKSVKFNINEILQESGMFESGFSRYQHKQSCYENGISSPADIAKTAKIGSYATLKSIKVYGLRWDIIVGKPSKVSTKT